MKTYQDFLEACTDEATKMQFVKSAISEHKSSSLYNTAVVADLYDRHKNKTIMDYKKMLYTISGEAVPDNYSANYKLPSNFFNRFVVQEVQYLLGNGVTWENDETKKKLGNDFDQRLQELGKASLVGAVSFGFWNLDHLEVFAVTEFVPLYDEENGALMAGIRFWQIDASKPLRATLYELDGYTEYLWNKRNEGHILKAKRTYKQIVRTSKVDGTEIYNGYNYPSFPIIPLFGNPHKQSELVGLREEIDAYDLIQSGFANDVDDASQIYWIINNAGGMDDIDLAKFIQHMKIVGAATVEDDGAKAEAHTIDVPTEGRETILTRLENTLYKDAMALNVETIASGAITATQIKASYEPLNSKVDQFEMCILDFLYALMKVAEIDDTPTFTRSVLVNVQEDVQTILQASEYLSSDYITRKILTLFGDADKADEVLKQMEEEENERVPIERTLPEDEETEDIEEEV